VIARWSTALLAAASLAASGAQADDEDTAALQWITQHAQPIDSSGGEDDFLDLRGMREVVGDARVVSFGEPIHLTEEFLALRNRLCKFLVVELGFTAIALETGFTDGVVVDDYVMGRSAVAPVPTRRAFSFAEVEFEQNRLLLEWLRAHNAKPTTRRKVRFYGHSMVGRGDWDAAASRGPADAALAYAVAVSADAPADAARLRELSDRLQPLLAKMVQDYDVMSSSERDALTAGVADVIGWFERRRVDWQARTSHEAFERAQRFAFNAMQIDADKRASGAHGALRSKRVANVDLNQNDAAMAANVRWMLEQEGADGRLFVFAHNGHVQKCHARSEYKFTALGEHLRAMLGRDLVVIGTTAHQGRVGLPDKAKVLQPSDAATLTATLARVQQSVYLLNLQSIPPQGTVAGWWNRTVRFRSNHGYSELNPANCFDALVFVREVSPVRLDAMHRGYVSPQ
jgi:erythromycin esterase